MAEYDDEWFSRLDSILQPESIAIIGASQDPGKTGGRILRSVRNGGFSGRVVLVNPRRAEISGIPCVPEIAAAGQPVPDVAYIALPRAQAIQQVAACGAAGVAGCVVVGTGFGEEDRVGRQFQDQLLRIARQAGVRLIGPNCIGLISPRRSLNLEAAITLQEPARLGPVGVISQSGSLMLCIYHGIADAGSGISFAVSVGNQVDVAIPELMRYGARDPHTEVLAIYAEALGDVDKFLAAAAECRNAGTRVVILKAGGSQAGSEVTASHTAAILGSDSAFAATCRDVGVLIADDIDVMAQAAVVLTRWPVPRPATAAVISSSGGGAAVLADQLGAAGISIASLRPDTLDALGATLNPIGRRAIIDFGRRSPGRVPIDSAGICNALMADPGVGAGIFSLTVTPAMTERCKAVAEAARQQDKLMIATMMPGSAGDDCVRLLRDLNIPCMPQVDGALRLLKLLWQTDGTSGQSRPYRRRPPRRRRPAGQAWLSAEQTADLLRQHHIAQPAGGFAETPVDAEVIAEGVGYPVVLKAAVPGLVHKSDVGGVVLNVGDAAALRAAWRSIAGRTGQLQPGSGAGCYVQKMVTGLTELLLSARLDPQFGPILTVGAGGLLAELIGDVQVRRLPISRTDARQMLGRLALWPVLAGYRGASSADTSAVVDAMIAVGSLLTRNSENVREVEINPLIVGTAGTGVAAVDTRIRRAGRS
jgi:acyl-CoA synthetase (NDP forming)